MTLRSSEHLSVWFYAMKQRILLGFASILILFVGMGLYALWLFTRLEGSMDSYANHVSRVGRRGRDRTLRDFRNPASNIEADSKSDG